MRSLWSCLLVVACVDEPVAPMVEVPARAAPVATGASWFLDTLEPSHVALPERNVGALADTIPVRGPFRYGGVTRTGMHRWIAPFPARARGLFFHKPEDGMALHWSGTPLRYDRHGVHERPTWVHDRREITIFTPDEGTPPEDGSVALVWPTAVAREAALNQAEAKVAAVDFVRRSVQLEWDTRRGLYLPAPGELRYEIDVPPAGELHLAPGIVPPEVDTGDRSDGASLVISVVGEAEVARLPLEVDAFPPRVVDLSRWAGQRITLSLASDPCPTPTCPTPDTTLDYVFLAEPAVASRVERRRRVVMVFVDTLRADHMSLYGYHRDTTAPLDQRLAGAAVFDNARTVAPWTLPSARSALTGRHPESWGVSRTLPEVFHARGEPTAFLTGNIYLSTQFEMDRGWDLHRVELWPSADEVTDQALAWLDEHEGRGGLLQVHYMDPHLPYLEPDTHRRLYAGDTPDDLREQFHLSDVRKHKDLSEPTKQWIRDRYDNNVRYTADAVARLLDGLDDDDIVVLYSDHGEELFDHGGFEHGHAIWDELLRVPLVVKAPGLPAGRHGVPVSLLDITPTILELIDAEPTGDEDGRSLVGVARGADGAAAAFEARDLGFGRVLYGTEWWGVLSGGTKYITLEGREMLYDVASEPGERTNLSLNDLSLVEPYRGRLPEAVGMEVAVGWRFVPSAPKEGNDAPIDAICSVPGGVSRMITSDDPLGNGVATAARVSREEAGLMLTEWGVGDEHPVLEGSDHILMRWEGSPREVVLDPVEEMSTVGHAVRCTARSCVKVPDALRDCPIATLAVDPGRDPGLVDLRTPLARAGWGRNRTWVWSYGILPVPDADSEATDGHHDELKGALEAIGYVEP